MAEGKDRRQRQKAKAEGEGVDRRIKQTWQRQNTNAAQGKKALF